MATLIEQFPLYSTLPVGQEIIFSVSNSGQLQNLYNAKFIAKVYISNEPIVIGVTPLVGTFKTTPNAVGIGMFDFSPIVESFVNADNLGATNSEYKTLTGTDGKIPLHLINKYSTNDNTLRYLAIQFDIEGATTPNGNVSPLGETKNTITYTLLNGYLKYTDSLSMIAGNFGYFLGSFDMNTLGGRFLTNAPTTQYANIEDYGTLSFMSTPTTSVPINTTVDDIYIIYYNSSGGTIASDVIHNRIVNGGFDAWDSKAKNQLLHIGCFPANLRNWNSNIVAAMGADLSYYTVALINNVNQRISETVTININCPTLKGFEPIRLTWLNQWGVWDYYTFKMKSTKSISTKGSTYQQMEGTWNKSRYQVNGYKGGKKSFRVNATEKISMNTDFVNEAESEWFEELINSPEVYILEGFQDDLGAAPINISALNKYVTPVRLTTSSYTKKTVANDKLMQYTFEVEKSKTLRTQAV
tara:strand:+ start:988 stop:2394 length:1407 start_codon:yes stop_codon:yes gene_type:complete